MTGTESAEESGSTDETSGAVDTATEELTVELLQQRLDNKTRRITRSVEFNIVASTVVVGVVQFSSTDTVPLSGLVVGGVLVLILSVAVSFVGLALAAHPIGRCRETDHTASVRNVYEQRNRALGFVQSVSFLTGSSGTGLFVLASAERAGVLRLGVSLHVVFLAVFVLFAYALGIGHVVVECWPRRVDGSEHTGTDSPDD